MDPHSYLAFLPYPICSFDESGVIAFKNISFETELGSECDTSNFFSISGIKREVFLAQLAKSDVARFEFPASLGKRNLDEGEWSVCLVDGGYLATAIKRRVTRSTANEAMSMQFSASGRILIESGGCSEMFCETGDSVIGKSVYDLVSQESQAGMKKSLARSILRRLETSIEFEARGGASRFALKPVYDDDQFICFLAESQLVKPKAVKKLVQPEPSRLSNLLATMSHDLKTPLNSILGFSRLLGQSSLEDDLAIYAQSIEESGGDLLSMLADLIDLAKVETGCFVVEKEWFGLESVSKEWQTELSYRAQRGREKVDLRFRDDCSWDVRFDFKRLKELFYRVVSLCEARPITVEVFVEESSLEKGTGCLVVEFFTNDEGDVLGQLASGAAAGSWDGESNDSQRLNLWIIREIAGCLGLSFESSQGKRRSVRMIWDGVDVEKSKRISKSSVSCLENLQPVTVLGVDDSTLNLLLLQKLFEGTAHRLITARSGVEALELLNTTRVDAIISDICMPGMSGLEMAIEIGKLEGSVCRKIVFVSSDRPSFEGLAENGIVYGFVEKPVTSSSLGNALGNLGAGSVYDARLDLNTSLNTIENRPCLSECSIDVVALKKSVPCLVENRWQGFRQRMELDQLEQFSDDLFAFGEASVSKDICQIAKSLKAYVEEFDLESLELVLDDLEALCLRKN